jgi:hypothetical protein
MTMDLVNRLTAGVIFHLALVPVVGAAFLVLCLRALRLPDCSFWLAWKTYLAAVAYALLALVLLNWAAPLDRLAYNGAIIQAAVVCLVHFLAVTLLLRGFTRRQLLAQGIAVILTNVVVLAYLVAGSG